MTPQQKDKMHKDKYRWSAKGIATAQRYRLKRIYKITPEDYASMFREQCGRCAVCFRQPEGGYDNLCVDHYKDKVRGLLCFKCNTAIGKLGDTTQGLARALAYVKGELRSMSAVEDSIITSSLTALIKRPELRSAVTFVTPTVTIKVTKQRRMRKNAKQKTFLVSVGDPNFLERRMLKAGKVDKFPLRKYEEFPN